MRRIYFLLALAALPTHSQVGSIALYYKFQHTPSNILLEAIKTETNSILSPEGLRRMQWKTLPSTGHDVTSDLAVITFQGHCSSTWVFSGMSRDARLGWTHVSDREVLPFAGIDCDKIGEFVGKKLLAIPLAERERVFGRAIARVLAHELDHIFARSTEHTDSDIDQPSYTADELVADLRPDGPRQTHILRAATTAEPASGASSAKTGKSIFQRSGCAACHGAEGQGTRRGPVLRAAGKFVTAVVLATRLARDEHRMSSRARSLKLPAPSISESDLQDLVTFLNTPPPRP